MTVCFCPYFQGKSRIASKIIALMPPHLCYVEAFCGMASVFFNKRPSRVEVLNDASGDIVNLHYCTKKDPARLIKELDILLYSRQVFTEFLKEFRNPIADPFALDYRRAAKYYYVQLIGFSSKPPMAQTPGGFGYSKKRNKALDYVKKIKQLEGYSIRLRNAIIENLDFKDCVSRYDGPETLFFLDPPYLESANPGIDLPRERHYELADQLKHVEGLWILTYDDHSEVRTLFKGFPMRFVDVTSLTRSSTQQGNIRTRRVSHLIIMNYDPNTFTKVKTL